MITVVTPTYNRAHTLEKCYLSLINQTCHEFEWLIVDDGSSDNTEQLVAKWILEEKIKISYIKKANGGKASALNLGIKFLKTQYAVCLDSDDYFTKEAVEIANYELDKIKDDNTKCGVLALRSHESGKVLGGREIPEKYTAVTAEELLIDMDLRTEFISFYKTDILKKFSFPEFKGEKFVPPSWMMFAITQKYKYVVSHSRFCVCEYYDDGITKNKINIILRNPRGYSCAKLWYFNLSKRIKQTVRHGIMYDCGCIIAKDKEWLANSKKKGWAIILMPIAGVVYLRRFKKVGFDK